MIKAEAILPKRFNARAWEKHFKQEAREWAEEVNEDYTKSHRTFSRKSTPQHKTTVKVNRDRVEATIEMLGKIYAIVHQGSPPHKIRAKGRGLKFKTGYKAKTLVGYFTSYPGGPYGSNTGAQEVNHPGFPGRQQSKAIKNNRSGSWARHMQRAMDLGAKDSGHAI